jgi:hypothetical protein
LSNSEPPWGSRYFATWQLFVSSARKSSQCVFFCFRMASGISQPHHLPVALAQEIYDPFLVGFLPDSSSTCRSAGAFKDLMDGTGKSKAGYSKIQFCGEQARRDGLQYFWVDTCCIDKSNSTELAEAINSMFRWYEDGTKCYVYLPDVSRPRSDSANKSNEPWESTFRKSRWFNRGWTLQELIAPASIEFFSKEGEVLGNKASLERHICEITGIPVKALRGGSFSFYKNLLKKG